MATPKSPFLIIPDLLSPLKCEQVVDSLNYFLPDTDDDDNIIKMSKHHERSEDMVYEHLLPLLPQIEQHYGVKHRGTELMNFDFHATGTKPVVQCDNSSYVNKQWARTRDRDFSIVVFLSDFNDQIPFDSDYEVYGGKLEFPQHNFGFNPQRGTAIIYPSGPHFINAFSDIIAGDLFAIRIYFTAEVPYFHDPKNFPGDFKSWFD